MTNERVQRIISKLERELGSAVLSALCDPDVTDVVLNPDGRLWVEKFGEGRSALGEMTPTGALALMSTLASYHETVITKDKPILECEIPIHSARFEGLIPPVVTAPIFAIRRRPSRIYTLQEYVDAGTLEESHRQQIEEAIRSRSNILVVGGTGTGKTTLTNAILQRIVEIHSSDRIVILEDTPELLCSAAESIPLRTCPGVDMQALLRATVRLHPQRIVVGEVRGHEAWTLLKAWNTGHPGGIATVHADDARKGLRRLEHLVAEGNGGQFGSHLQRYIAEVIDLIVSIERVGSRRRVKELVRVLGFEDGEYLFSQ